MKEIIAMLMWVVGIILSLFAIYKIVGNLEITIGLISLSFGILAVIWTSIARKSLSIGSSLRKYTSYFLFCIVFILAYSIWGVLGEIIRWKGILVYLGYIFLMSAFFVFTIASYQIHKIGQEFGFEKEAKRIKKAMKKNNIKKSKVK